MKKIIWIVLILSVATGIFIFYKKRNSDKPIEFNTEQMHTGSISNSITATGTIEPVDTVNVGSQVSGTIQNIGVGASRLVNIFLNWPTLVSASSILISFAVCGVTGIFFGYYPAVKASRLDPIEALHYE